MISAYKQVELNTSNPEELSKRVFSSIGSYLAEFKDTSRKKADRIQSMKSAKIIIDWVMSILVVNSFESDLLAFGLGKVQDNIDSALNSDNVVSVDDSIGFLKLISANK